MADLPRTARVVVIGGGVVGCSVLYHLGRAGWRDCVLLERNELTSARNESLYAASRIINTARDFSDLISIAT